jgi:uncharacterized membrane protein
VSPRLESAPRVRGTLARTAARVVLSLLVGSVGVLHFVSPEPFVAIVPRALPAPLALVLVSGAAEVAGALGLVSPWREVRRLAAWGLVLLFVAVFPANVNMAVNRIALPGAPVLPDWALYGRLPLQLALVAWAAWLARAERVPHERTL